MQETPPNKTRVRIFLDRFTVIGEIGLLPGTRMTDYMISAHEFIAVTNAVVRTPDDREVFRSDFLNIQKIKVVMIVPENMVTPA